MADVLKPLIVQSDMSLLLETDSPLYADVRDAIAPFAEMVKCPEHVHTYKITPLSLWNAAAAGLAAPEVLARLRAHSRFPIMDSMAARITDLMGRYGRIRLLPHDATRHRLAVDDPILLERFRNDPAAAVFIGPDAAPGEALVRTIDRGPLKQALIKAGFPVQDLAGYIAGSPLAVPLRESDRFRLRPYQSAARDAFFKGGTWQGGSGVVALPCGAGKTIVGLAAMNLIGAHTLILATGITAIRQWRRELLDKTGLADSDIGEYSGATKDIRPVTLTNYQLLTYRKRGPLAGDDFPHFHVLNGLPWGLIIYDEVHLLPARVFRFTASLQAVRRLGLTATLVREDGREADVFSLIGPKCYDVPWKVIERQGWIARAVCREVKVPADAETWAAYAAAEPRGLYRAAAENPAKLAVLERVMARHPGEKILIIGQYLDQLAKIAAALDRPLLTGETPQDERERLYREFRDGDLDLLVVSSVANFAVDLPDASVAIQVSGKFGSRQEEAQRLGRILRPKADGRPASFYTLVTADTEEEDFALRRQMFLIEEGYEYEILR
ncbi:MAG: DEAD/DEAH box helicase [Candidatus Aminicenantes bacterium]|nr:DEAD/DEAH box helicase [Candidatus Aminicenantes bacterium]